MLHQKKQIPEKRIQQLLKNLDKDAATAGLSPKEVFKLKEDCQKVLKRTGTFTL